MSLDSHDVFRVQTSEQAVPKRVRFRYPAQPVPAFSFGTLPSSDVSAGELTAGLPPSDPGQFRRWRLRQSALLLTADVLVLAAAASAVSVVTEATGTQSPWDSAGKAVVMLIWLAMLVATGGYRIRGVHLKSLTRPAVTSGAAMLGVSALMGLLTNWEPAREFILLSIPAGLLGLLAVRLSWYTVNLRRPDGTLGKRHVVVLGETTKAERVHRELLRGGGASGYVVAQVLTWDGNTSGPSREYHGKRNGVRSGAAAVAQARDAVLTSGADLVVLAGSDVLDAGAVRALAWELAELDVELATASGLCDVAGWRLRSESVRGLAMVHVELPRLRGFAAAYKRGFDIAFSAFVLLVMAPLLLLLGAAVKLDDRGPALFTQQRVGLDHRKFTMLKFRSMSMDAEVRRTELLAHSEGNEVLFKMRNDPRVTRVGRVLRRFSLDELPQFLNVLRGDMSVVGPRPPLPSETEAYDDHADRRLIVKPGITGLWQVHGRSDLSWEESLRLDLYYVENWSPGTDIGIVLRTAWAMVTGAGAY
ncbi:sugar transferase [Garicola koreensis]|uniref:Exopolysaccharide biosynthesis polyprenyl glycosylphosphotransferase n=1 Tax=Garicola koreensis TaxID=1262554 RepID=A0A7W5TTN9_9MICC|nr:sugar transferase [Garicola koreensis]MBB3667578.1 exopolysaccharide biosynthesis polyprenyl glycosylphosphotransferase [Garicola koreensis]